MVFICRPVSYRTLSKTLRQTLRISLISDDNYYSDRLLGDRRKRIYRIVRSFCPDSRRNNRRIVNYATVIATPKLGKRTSKLVCSLIEITLGHPTGNKVVAGKEHTGLRGPELRDKFI
ncbi:MAG: hypothetical protein BECKG1743F_GA0114225_100744 [Candidatus Kentron sp. G]|nr:MAG: hypothetical protein BECKG1743F_GA0114225_100744 [Candidatus Kentron sp. G]VFM96785.1 MAG: hypothetical protein BECKG1743E_GA0114224_100864 [Candidatus Kentron sp. G]